MDCFDLDINTLAFTDYQDNPTEHQFNFSKVTENGTAVINNNLKKEKLFGKDNISNNLFTVKKFYCFVIVSIPFVTVAYVSFWCSFVTIATIVTQR